MDLPIESDILCQKPLRFDGNGWFSLGFSGLHLAILSVPSSANFDWILSFAGFNSLFLYRRLYRCYTTLNGFGFDNGNVERSKNLSLEEFYDKYDEQKPVWCFATD